MEYYEYTDLNTTTIHTLSYNCNFNLGIWLPSQPYPISVVVNLSLDGEIWANFSYFSLPWYTAGSVFYNDLSGFNFVQIEPLDGETFNFGVGEYYEPIHIMQVGV